MPPTFDVVDYLRTGISKMPDGPHIAGLRAVVAHLDTAIGHLQRGRLNKDETAFTDVIYRTNQAFEGSIKEAYRVLAKENPSNKRPFDIEEYLQEKEIFRPRVLDMFKSYRTEWRNPSAHDYLLDFDESEAVLAIITVAAFGYLLSDQISESLARDAEVSARPLGKESRIESASEDMWATLLEVISLFPQAVHSGQIHTESQILGSLAGFIERVAPHFVVKRHATISEGARVRADLLVELDGRHAVIEIKRGDFIRNFARDIDQLRLYLDESNSTLGVPYIHPNNDDSLILKKINYNGGVRSLQIAAFVPQRILTPTN